MDTREALDLWHHYATAEVKFKGDVWKKASQKIVQAIKDQDAKDKWAARHDPEHEIKRTTKEDAATARRQYVDQATEDTEGHRQCNICLAWIWSKVSLKRHMPKCKGNKDKSKHK